MERESKSETSLTTLEARVLLSIKKNLTFINLVNLKVDWPDCGSEAQDWQLPLQSLTRREHILAYEAVPEAQKIKLLPVPDLDFKKDLVFKLSVSGERLLAEAKKAAMGEPKPTLVHNTKNGSWKVIR